MRSALLKSRVTPSAILTLPAAPSRQTWVLLGTLFGMSICFSGLTQSRGLQYTAQKKKGRAYTQTHSTVNASVVGRLRYAHGRPAPTYQTSRVHQVLATRRGVPVSHLPAVATQAVPHRSRLHQFRQRVNQARTVPAVPQARLNHPHQNQLKHRR